MLQEKLKKIVEENKDYYQGYIRNALKEYLQLAVLDFIYNSDYSFLIFKGGSCLRIAFDLPRLSEDIDIDSPKNINQRKFFKEIEEYFHKEQNFPTVETKIGEQRCYFKFPILKELKIAGPSESDKLYLKIDIRPAKDCEFTTENQPVFERGFNFMLRRYDIATLMAGKIEAVLERVWFKGKSNEITVKGRDFFDLYWYLDNNIEPNYDCIFYKGKNLSQKEVWQLIKERIDKVKAKDLEYDLVNLIKDQNFVKKFSSNYQSIIKRKIALLEIA